MSITPSVNAPAGFVPEYAIAFGTQDGPAVAVDAANPLPTSATIVPALSAPLVGTAATTSTVGPFTPQLGRAIWLTLSGTWTGTAQLLRSTDGGTTKLPLTAGGQSWGSFTANCNEAVAEESVSGATYYLAVTLASGSLGYRVAQ